MSTRFNLFKGKLITGSEETKKCSHCFISWKKLVFCTLWCHIIIIDRNIWYNKSISKVFLWFCLFSRVSVILWALQTAKP